MPLAKWTRSAPVPAETGAIFEHILDVHDTAHRLHAPRDTAYGRTLTYWLHYAEGSAMTPLLLKLVFARLADNAPWLTRALVRGIAGRAQTNFVDPRVKEHVDYWEASLAATGYFVGEAFTAADVMMSFPLEAARSRYPLTDYPHIQDFLTRMHARPAYARALERGGPYAYA